MGRDMWVRRRRKAKEGRQRGIGKGKGKGREGSTRSKRIRGGEGRGGRV